VHVLQQWATSICCAWRRAALETFDAMMMLDSRRGIEAVPAAAAADR